MNEIDKRLNEQLADIQRLAANGSPQRLLRPRLEALLQNELKNLETRNDRLLQIIRVLKDLHASPTTTLRSRARRRPSGTAVIGIHNPKRRLVRETDSAA